MKIVRHDKWNITITILYNGTSWLLRTKSRFSKLLSWSQIILVLAHTHSNGRCTKNTREKKKDNTNCSLSTLADPLSSTEHNSEQFMRLLYFGYILLSESNEDILMWMLQSCEPSSTKEHTSVPSEIAAQYSSLSETAVRQNTVVRPNQPHRGSKAMRTS